MKRRPTNSDDIIDSRDVRKAIEEIKGEIEALDADQEDEAEELKEELKALESLEEDGEHNASDWKHGATLIADAHFEDYAREFAEDIGAIDESSSWPACHIDWEKAADALKMDYTQLDFNGSAYWVHS